MKHVSKILAFSFSLALLSACSNGGGGAAAPGQNNVVGTGQETPVSSEQFAYEYKINNCTTGRQQFHSKKEYCDGLLNDALNRSCAADMRISAFNRFCSLQSSNPAVLGSATTARCVANGADLQERSLLQSLNPFKPRSRQVVRDLFWSGREPKSFEILGSFSNNYGNARYNLEPAKNNLPAQGELQLTQKDDSYTVRSALGSQVTLNLLNSSVKRQVQVACMSDVTFKPTKADLRRVTCRYVDERVQKEETLIWNLQQSLEQQVFRTDSKDTLVVRLNPSSAGQDEQIEINLQSRDNSRTLNVVGSLNEGLEFRYQGRQSGLGYMVKCFSASK